MNIIAMLKENPEETLTGLFVGLAFVPALGWWTLAVAPLCMFLYRLGGYKGYSKIYRRLGCPAVILLPCCLVRHSAVPLLSLPLAFAWLSIGWDIPDGNSEGSYFGRFIVRVFRLETVSGGGWVLSQIVTRFCYGLILSVAFVFVPMWWLWLGIAFPVAWVMPRRVG